MAESEMKSKPKRMVVRREHAVILDRALGLRLREYVEREWRGDRRLTGAIFRKALSEFLDRQQENNGNKPERRDEDGQ